MRTVCLRRMTALWAVLVAALVAADACEPQSAPGVFAPSTDPKARSDVEWIRKHMIASNKGRKDLFKMYHRDLVSFIDKYFGPEQPFTWVEIGTAFGMTTDYVLSHLPNAIAHAVDPCMAAYDAADDTAIRLETHRKAGKLTHDEFSLAWAGALVAEQTKQKRACRYNLHRNFSTAAADGFATATIDVLFIDGLHTYSGVLADLTAYWPKLKPRSLLIFNDWKGAPACHCTKVGPRCKGACAFPGVRNAACSFLPQRGVGPETPVIVEGPVGTTNAALALGMEPRDAASRQAIQSRIEKHSTLLSVCHGAREHGVAARNRTVAYAVTP